MSVRQFAGLVKNVLTVVIAVVVGLAIDLIVLGTIAAVVLWIAFQILQFFGAMPLIAMGVGL